MGQDFGINKIEELQDNVYQIKEVTSNTFDFISKEAITTGTVGQVYTIQLTKIKEGILKIAHDNVENEIKESISSFKLVKNLFKVINKKIYRLIKNIDLDEFARFF